MTQSYTHSERRFQMESYLNNRVILGLLIFVLQAVGNFFLFLRRLYGVVRRYVVSGGSQGRRIGDLKVSDAICQGVQKHWDRVRGQRNFPYNFHIGVSKNLLHIFFKFSKKCRKDRLILTFLIKYCVFSEIWTEFHLNQRKVNVETRRVFRSVFELFISLRKSELT